MNCHFKRLGGRKGGGDRRGAIHYIQRRGQREWGMVTVEEKVSDREETQGKRGSDRQLNQLWSHEGGFITALTHSHGELTSPINMATYVTLTTNNRSNHYHFGKKAGKGEKENETGNTG